MIKLDKQIHRGEQRLFLIFEYDAAMVSSIKTIPGRRYSGSKKCWHLPTGEASLSALEKLRIPYTFPTTGTTVCESTKGDHTGISCDQQESSAQSSGLKKEAAGIRSMMTGDIEVRWNDRQFTIRMDYNEKDVAFLKSLAGSWWNSETRLWIVRSRMRNLEALQQHFACWNVEDYTRLYELIGAAEDPMILELYHVPEHEGKIAVRLKGYKASVEFLKRIPSRCYERPFKRWIIPHTKENLTRIKEHYEELGARIIDRIHITATSVRQQKPTLHERQAYFLSKFDLALRPPLKTYTDTLIGGRYSWNTIKSYGGEFAKFLIYLKAMHIRLELCRVEDVNTYLNREAGQAISDSLLNVKVSALKYYYDKVVFRPEFGIKKIRRPRKSRYLPTILSIGEVDAMMRSLSNLKHVCLLYTIYSGGLRLNELLSLRLEDIYWDRNQIMIKGSKGKKDRMVMLSEVLKEVMKLYTDQYQPVYWLFEGQGGRKPYSAKSVQSVVKKAARRAGISRKVTPHTLRHCFATHLLDRGTDVRYIQELLGHKDIKTTLIYTHVTTRKVTSIESPLDALMKDMKKAKK